MLPISPRRLFIAANTRNMVDRLDEAAKGAGLAQRVNNRVSRQARKYVYAVDDAPLDLVAERLGDRLRWSPFE